MSFSFSVEDNAILPDVKEILPSSFCDKRGSLWTSFDQFLNKNLSSINLDFKHDKFSFSKKGVLRGIHGDSKSWKLVSCPWGKVFQVVVDNRVNSKTYLKTTTMVLDGNKKKMLLIPPMFGNGFCAFETDVLYHYKLAYDGDYSDADSQFTINWNDNRLNIDWPLTDPILSERDG